MLLLESVALKEPNVRLPIVRSVTHYPLGKRSTQIRVMYLCSRTGHKQRCHIVVHIGAHNRVKCFVSPILPQISRLLCNYIIHLHMFSPPPKTFAENIIRYRVGHTHSHSHRLWQTDAATGDRPTDRRQRSVTNLCSLSILEDNP